MEWFEAIVLGFVQGLTEFLPVSSSGHLMIARDLLGLSAPEDLVFETTVHCATVLSTIVVFRREIWQLLRGLFRFRYNDETDYVCKLVVSMIPILVVGFLFKDVVEGLFSSLTVVAVALLVTAALLFFSDIVSSRHERREAAHSAGFAFPPATGIASDSASFPVEVAPDSDVASLAGSFSMGGGSRRRRNGISYWQAFVAGIAQAVAVIPGLSRSGATIATGLLCGVRRGSMAQFSFLMVLVPILGESCLDVAKGGFGGSSAGVLALLLGFVTAFVTGLLACKAMVALVRRSRLRWFALYCLIVAVLVFVFK